ncbi:VCBS repeat-containing protein [Neiella sp. HB171785]|uniref:VCBS repeat-containing protein n=1 Tax=Neiella litorisoli TaxID=2771431 RepID=A0A8J6QEB2_9GAMM|nr:VCBS repeat-containing protein [Neiella litorisoli]MBD1387954.1 VCBS repeat-containing protein [Neiella litorisoli]
MFRTCLFVMSCVLLSACGGGGGGSSSTPSNGSTTPPKTQPSSKWDVSKPNYSGLRSNYPIDEVNVVETLYSTLESIDLLTSMAFSSSKRLYFIEEDSSSALTGDAQCESGSFTEKEVEPSKKLELTFSDCRTEGAEIDGTIRAVVENDDSISAILDLSMKDLESAETVTFSGYYNLSSRTEATFNLMLEASDGEQLWFDGLSLSQSMSGDAFGTYIDGNIYISDLGKLRISTISLGKQPTPNDMEYAFTQLQIEGDKRVTFDVELQHQLKLLYSADVLPVEVPLDSSVVFDSNKPNSSPIAKTEQDNFVTSRSETIKISATPSTDPDYDLIKASWEILNQPESSNVTLVQGNTLSLRAEIPGNYTIRLTVSDTQGNQSHKDVDLYVRRNAPTGTINNLHDYHISEQVKAQVSLENDEFDGPFSYHVKYGPANMSIDNSGLISWDGAIPDYGHDTEVNFAVVASNADAYQTLEHSLVIQSKSKPTINKRTNASLAKIPLHQGESGKWYYFDNPTTEWVVEDNLITEKYHNFIIPGMKSDIEHQATSDVNNDGNDDFWYSKYDQEKNQHQIYWQDGLTTESNLFITLDKNTDSAVNIYAIDYDQDEVREIVVQDESQGYRIYEPQTGELAIEVSSEINIDFSAVHLCDFNNDGYLDFFNELSKRGNQLGVNSITGDAFSGMSVGDWYLTAEKGTTYAQFVDTDDKPTCEYLISNDDQLIYLSTKTTEGITLLDQSDLFREAVNVADIDGDGEQEILVYGQTSSGGQIKQAAYIINRDSGNQFSTKQTPFDMPIYDHLRFNHLRVLDIDHDGTDELVTFEYISKTLDDGTYISNVSDSHGTVNPVFVQYKAYNIESDTLVLVSLTEEHAEWVTYELAYWNDDGALSLFAELHRGLAINTDITLNSDVTYNGFDFSTTYDFAIEDSSPVFYQGGAPRGTINKTDQFGNILWSQDLTSNGYDVERISALGSGPIFVEQDNASSILHPESGEVLATDAGYKHIRGSHFSHYQNADGSSLFASLLSGRLFKISRTNSISSIDLQALEAPFNYYYYAFAQIDDDPQAELVAYSRNLQNYSVIDTESLIEQEAGRYFSATSELSEEIWESVFLQCFEWDSKCKNFVSISNDDGSSYQVIDKLTGKTIWKSPVLATSGSKFFFKRQDSSIKTLVSSRGEQIFTIE